MLSPTLHERKKNTQPTGSYIELCAKSKASGEFRMIINTLVVYFVLIKLSLEPSGSFPSSE